eukprot:3181459-Rhodomonas_salina.8
MCWYQVLLLGAIHAVVQQTSYRATRICYAMPSTDVMYAAPSELFQWYCVRYTTFRFLYCVCTCYAQPGTGRRYTDTVVLSPVAPDTPRLVLTPPVVLLEYLDSKPEEEDPPNPLQINEIKNPSPAVLFPPFPGMHGTKSRWTLLATPRSKHQY